MNRKYDSAEYAAICQRIRRYFPDCAITTDFMVGFPGETDEDFRDSLAFAQRMAFAAMHVFRYSPRAGTRAAAFPEQCSGAEKTARMEQAQKAAKTAKENFLKSQIGTEFPVLFERERGDGYHVGHTPNGTVVRISAKNPKKSLRNRIFCVRIEESDAECCYGTLTESGLDEDLVGVDAHIDPCAEKTANSCCPCTSLPNQPPLKGEGDQRSWWRGFAESFFFMC